MPGLGVVLCALGLPASHQSHHKSHTPDSDAAAPPGHALPASAKTHAVSKHKAVKHTAKSRAKSHHAHAAKSHVKHAANSHKDDVVQHAAAEAAPATIAAPPAAAEATPAVAAEVAPAPA